MIKKWSSKEMVLMATAEVEKLKLKFGTSGRGVRASEIAMVLPYSKPTVYRYLRELYDEGYVEADKAVMNKRSSRTTAYFWLSGQGKEHCEMREVS